MITTPETGGIVDATRVAVLGVAGNMTGHLEQAGEAEVFADVRAAADRPKGMFPIYLPGLDHRLGVWPFSADWLRLPDEAVDVQPEPEVALHVELTWDEGGVAGIAPRWFAAADDTSLRKSAPRIHHKKNWGASAKGLSNTWIPLEGFRPGASVDRFRLASWLLRDGTVHPYGEDSAVRDYQTHHEPLLEWMVDRLRHQAEGGPLDHLAAWLDRAGRPPEAVLLIGATRYTPFGADTYVAEGDEVVVAVYDEAELGPRDVAREVAAGVQELPHASLLRRRVVGPNSAAPREDDPQE